MKRLAVLLAAACAGLLMPPAASAYDAYAAKDAHLRAGPARDYPVVLILPRGTALDVQGCLSDYSWCDVIALGQRGWVYAANIDALYEGTPEPLIDYGPYFGITVFGFVLGDYWDLHYRDRPWYHDRGDWIRQPRPPQPPIPPHRPPPGLVPPPHPVQPPPPVRPHPVEPPPRRDPQVRVPRNPEPGVRR